MNLTYLICRLYIPDILIIPTRYVNYGDPVYELPLVFCEILRFLCGKDKFAEILDAVAAGCKPDYLIEFD